MVSQVLTSIGNFCICSIATGMVIEVIVLACQGRPFRDVIENLLVLLIGGIPIAMPTVLSVTMAIGSHRLSQQVRCLNTATFRPHFTLSSRLSPSLLQSCFLQGAITKRMTAIEEMAGMDVLCSDKTGTLTLNKLSVDKNIVEVDSPHHKTQIA